MKVHSKGNELGYHKGKTIHEWITFASREPHSPEDNPPLMRFHFQRIGMENRDGHITTEQLKEGEIMIHPGLIYA